MYRNKTTRTSFAVLMIALTMTAAACGAESGQQETSGEKKEASSGETFAGTTAMEKGTQKTGVEAALAKVKIGPNEATNMVPADGKEPDEPQPLPKNPPEGVKLYPATTNATTEGGLDYDRTPPTNGKHDPLWQNCGFYTEPVKDRYAVHSLDHGVVWISYRPDLPKGQRDTLRKYANEDYTIISPYPNLPAPVVATAWRVQLKLDGANDPRLRQFVDDFKNTEIAPLSGNRCANGIGDPASS